MFFIFCNKSKTEYSNVHFRHVIVPCGINFVPSVASAYRHEKSAGEINHIDSNKQIPDAVAGRAATQKRLPDELQAAFVCRLRLSGISEYPSRSGLGYHTVRA